MRALKIISLSVVAIVVVFLLYGFFVEPLVWYPLTRRQSVKALKAAQNSNELSAAVGSLGLYLPLTNNAWIAIRYKDSHLGGIRSSAVARDSGGGWFESDRHFCGTFQAWPHLKDIVLGEEEQRQLTPDWFTNRVSASEKDNGIFPAYREINAIESAPNLESARRALEAIGFKPMRQ